MIEKFSASTSGLNSLGGSGYSLGGAGAGVLVADAVAPAAGGAPTATTATHKASAPATPSICEVSARGRHTIRRPSTTSRPLIDRVPAPRIRV
ncbi:MAG TPA: hypothetical protein VEJ23_08930 [Solirubrobacteraceae bacterium]|nr:hypothetical protein [Solirubrobacteraceae bacterium]